jgi:hypothetical protein
MNCNQTVEHMQKMAKRKRTSPRLARPSGDNFVKTGLWFPIFLKGICCRIFTFANFFHPLRQDLLQNRFRSQEVMWVDGPVMRPKKRHDENQKDLFRAKPDRSTKSLTGSIKIFRTLI